MGYAGIVNVLNVVVFYEDIIAGLPEFDGVTESDSQASIPAAAAYILYNAASYGDIIASYALNTVNTAVCKAKIFYNIIAFYRATRPIVTDSRLNTWFSKAKGAGAL